MESSRGLGPWYVGLFFNIGSTKKQTELRVHGSIHWFAPFRNLLDERDCWVTMMVIGPFLKWTDAVGFFHLWSRQTRGKARRMKRGITLLKCYKEQYNLNVWIQSCDKDEIVKQLEELPRAIGGKKQRLNQMLHTTRPDNKMTMQHVENVKRQRMN